MRNAGAKPCQASPAREDTARLSKLSTGFQRNLLSPLAGESDLLCQCEIDLDKAYKFNLSLSEIY